MRAGRNQTRSIPLTAILLAGLLLACAAQSGCSRAFWRKHADRNHYDLIRQKLFDPRWQVARIGLTPNPQSRLYDPYDPDCGPLPPDDPAAHRYMHYVAWFRAWRGWHKFGRALSIENPYWLAQFGLEPPEGAGPPTGPALLDDGVQLASHEGPAAGDTGRTDAGTRRVPDDCGPALGHTAQSSLSGEPAPLQASEDAVPLPPLPANGAGHLGTDDLPTADGLTSPPREQGTDAPAPGEPDAGDGACNPFGMPGAFGIRDLTLSGALELSYIHSREYQTAIEDVYLTALDLSFERFQFNLRFLGFAGEPTVDLEYRSTPDGPNDLELGTTFGVSQLLPTGGQFIAELANNTLWMFAGPNRQATASVLSYSLVQPLLRNAGRKIALENLTQTERNLLYAARDLARFRQVFFVSTVGGGGGTGSGGFLGLIQQLQAIANAEDNIRRLEFQSEFLQALASQRPEEALEPLPAVRVLLPLPGAAGPVLVDVPPPLLVAPESWPEVLRDQLRYDLAREAVVWRGTMTDIQEDALFALSDDVFYREAVNELVQKVRGEVLTQPVLQLRSRLLTQQQRLNSQRAVYQESLDEFKTELGLPPDFQVTIDRSLLKPFELIDPSLLDTERDLYDFLKLPDWTAVSADDPDLLLLRRLVARLHRLGDVVSTASIDLVEEDLRTVQANRPQRLADLPTGADRELIERTVARDERLYRTLRRALRENFREPLDELRELVANPGLPLEERRRAFAILAGLREGLLAGVQALQALQIGLRTELITLNPFDVSRDGAVALALHNRVDLMNIRAQVMDARRKSEIAANQLQAVLNVRAEGDIRTPPLGSGNNRPFNFRGDDSEFRVGLQFTAPLDQIDERNDYRAALIDYQRARRDYMEAEDEVKFQVRAAHRNLLVLEQNFELARQAVRIAALQLDSAVEETLAPARTVDPVQGDRGDRGGRSSAFNLLDALNNVLNAQDALIRTWVDYERNRLNIYRDMGIMVVDERGVWIDSFYQSQATRARSPADEPLTPPNSPPGPQEDNGARADVSGATPSGSSHEAERAASRSGSPAGTTGGSGEVIHAAGAAAGSEHGTQYVVAPLPDAAVDPAGGVCRGPRACRRVRLGGVAEVDGAERPHGRPADGNGRARAVPDLGH